MASKILITARSFRKLPGVHHQILKDAGLEIVFPPFDRPLSIDEMQQLVPEVNAIILGVDPANQEVIKRASNLKVIARYGVGLDNVDLPAATAAGIVVTCTPGVNQIAVAELTMGLMLAMVRHIPKHHQTVKTGGWSRIEGMELAGKNLGIIGMGRIGKEVAQRAKAFQMRLFYYKPVKLFSSQEKKLGIIYLSLAELLSVSDILTLHARLTSETKGMIGEKEIALMKPTAIIINTARGELIDEDALYRALKENKIAGAALDVLAQEPPPINQPLLKLENVLVTPHIGAYTREAILLMARLTAESVVKVLRGEYPENVVNPEVYIKLQSDNKPRPRH